MPDVGVHLHGKKLVQETSRSVWFGVAFLFVLAAIALVPISRFGLGVPYYVQVLAAIGLAWGAICLLFGAPYMERNFGQRVTVDLEKETVTIVRRDRRTGRDMETVISTAAVVGLQVLQAPSEEGGFQLNLVWRKTSGGIERINLTANTFRKYVLRIATAYQRALGWSLLEQ